jgi:hypothetical protein
MAATPLTVAIERYERHLPLIEGRVRSPPGFSLNILEVGRRANSATAGTATSGCCARMRSISPSSRSLPI